MIGCTDVEYWKSHRARLEVEYGTAPRLKCSAAIASGTNLERNDFQPFLAYASSLFLRFDCSSNSRRPKERKTNQMEPNIRFDITCSFALTGFTYQLLPANR